MFVFCRILGESTARKFFSNAGLKKASKYGTWPGKAKKYNRLGVKVTREGGNIHNDVVVYIYSREHKSSSSSSPPQRGGHIFRAAFISYKGANVMIIININARNTITE